MLAHQFAKVAAAQEPQASILQRASGLGFRVQNLGFMDVSGLGIVVCPQTPNLSPFLCFELFVSWGRLGQKKSWRGFNRVSGIY